MTAANEGKPITCPFCGGEAGMCWGNYVADRIDPHAIIECKTSGCGASMEFHSATVDGAKSQAVVAWNRRAQPTEAVDEAAEHTAFEQHCRSLWKEYGEDEIATMLSRYEDSGRYVVVATNNAWNGWIARARGGD